MKRIIFVEGPFPKEFYPLEEDVFIGITMEGCSFLEEQKISYSILSRWAPEEEVLEEEDAFFREQLNWFKTLDEILWKKNPSLRQRGIRPAILFNVFFKTCLDFFYIKGRQIEKILRKIKADVVYLKKPCSQSVPNLSGYYRDPEVYSRLLSFFCGRKGVSYREILCPYQIIGKKEISVPEKTFFSRDFVRFFRRSYHRFLGLMPSFHHSENPLTLLIAVEDYDFRTFAPEAAAAGHRVLVMSGSTVVDRSAHPFKNIASIERKKGEASVLQLWEAETYEVFSLKSSIWDWPDSWFHAPISELLSPLFQRWAAKVLPEMLFMAEEFAGVYEREKVDYVLTPYCSEFLPISAIAGAKIFPQTQSVSVLHGDSPLDTKIWDFLELFPHDHHVASHQDFADFLISRGDLYSFSTAKVHVGSQRWKEYSAYRKKGRSSDWTELIDRPLSKELRSLPLAVYVTTMPEVRSNACYGVYYQEAWYYQLIREIIRGISAQKEFLFIVKGFPGQTGQNQTILKLIREFGAENMAFSEVSFHKWLPHASRVMIDFPSTPLYQTALAGVPFHLLRYAPFKYWPKSMDWFLDQSSEFTTPEEASAAAAHYLSAPVVPHSPFPFQENGLLKALEGMA